MRSECTLLAFGEAWGSAGIVLALINVALEI